MCRPHSEIAQLVADWRGTMKGCKEEFVSLSEGFAAFVENHFNQDMLEILSLFFENVALSSKQAFIRVVPA